MNPSPRCGQYRISHIIRACTAGLLVIQGDAFVLVSVKWNGNYFSTTIQTENILYIFLILISRKF
jgi:hypothetical protein